MADTDLVFRDPPGGTDLVFGAGSSSEPGTRIMAIAARRPARRGVGVMSAPTLLYGVAKRPPRRGAGLSAYDARVSRPIVNDVSVRFQQGLPTEAGVETSWQNSRRVPVPVRARWQDATPQHAAAELGWQNAQRLRQGVDVRYQQALPLQVKAVRVRYQDSLHTARPWIDSRYQRALPLHADPTAIRFQQGLRTQLWRDSRYQRALPLHTGILEREQYGLPMAQLWGTRYQRAIRPPAGIYIRPVQPPFEPCFIPPPGGEVHLVFKDGPGTPRLVFVCERHGPTLPGKTIVVPIRRTYVTINTLELRRVDTGQPLLAYGFTLTTDADSWTWSWSASLRADTLAQVQRTPGADPIELEATLNGTPYRFLVERVARESSFPSTRISVSGRGLAAILDAPFCPTLSFSADAAMTAHQLMANALTVNGVSLGWDLDWQLIDWGVPAHAWSLQGSYMDAVVDIASAAGGYVQPHATEQQLRILPRYPVAPWEWSSMTPDIELPAAPVEVEATEWIDKPAYNRVWVGGVGAGVFGPVTRAGTAGDLLAQQVTHPLITHFDAFRQRGLAELADGGRQAHVRLSLQVLPETGLILPGKFVRYLGGTPEIGIVRSTSYDWGSKRQTIGIETHVA